MNDSEKLDLILQKLNNLERRFDNVIHNQKLPFEVVSDEAFRGPNWVDQCRITGLGRFPETLKSWLT